MIRLLIVGGGKVGAYLAEQLAARNHTVVVIEKERARADEVARNAGLMVLHGDGTEVALLRDGEVERCDWLLAVTGRDEDNLVACLLGVVFGARRVLARLNDPRNTQTFDALGIPFLSVAHLMTRRMTEEVDVDVYDAVRIATAGQGKVAVLSVEISDDLEPRSVVSLGLPPASILASVTRNGEVFVPGADSQIRGGDQVVAVCAVADEADVTAILASGSGNLTTSSSGETEEARDARQ